MSVQEIIKNPSLQFIYSLRNIQKNSPCNIDLYSFTIRHNRDDSLTKLEKAELHNAVEV